MVMKGKKILVVDDEDYIGDLIIDFLSLENIKGVKSGNFKEALTKASSESFDLIVSDVNIENDSVENFIITLKDNGITSPVILMTGDHRITEDFAKKSGSLGIILKPFQVAPFLTKIREFLEKT